MRTLLITSIGMFGAALLAAPAQAQYYYFGHSSAHANHARHHDDLEHRAFHRELAHREAHRYPMTHRQHERLHDHLDHEAFHDHLEHRAAHRNRAYSPRSFYGGHSVHHRGYHRRGSGFYNSRPGFSIHIGR